MKRLCSNDSLRWFENYQSSQIISGVLGMDVLLSFYGLVFFQTVCVCVFLTLMYL